MGKHPTCGRPVPPEDLLFDLVMVLRKAECLWSRRRLPGVHDSLMPAARAVAAHFELCGIRCYRRPPAGTPQRSTKSGSVNRSSGRAGDLLQEGHCQCPIPAVRVTVRADAGFLRACRSTWRPPASGCGRPARPRRTGFSMPSLPQAGAPSRSGAGRCIHGTCPQLKLFG